MKKQILGAVVLTLGLVAGLIGGASVTRAQEIGDSITINRPGMKCGEQDFIFTGSAQYAVAEFYPVIGGALDGENYFVIANDGSANWSTEAMSLDIGTYSFEAVLFDGTITATDTWEFEILECQAPDPVVNSTPCGAACEPWQPPQRTPSAPQCTSERPAMGIANIYVERTSATTATVRWNLHSGDNTHIIYGETGTGWKHAALDVGINGEITIGGLVAGRTYDWQAIPMNGCAAGDRSPVANNI